MKIILIGATGTIGAKVADALSAKKHEVIRASRNGDIKVNLTTGQRSGRCSRGSTMLMRWFPAPETPPSNRFLS